MTNHLIHEASPYLRQHADNPVDWHPWGEEALRKARKLDRPIFLSIGYSACHWCHVMEHESFEDPEVGRLLNDSFISIKVDREERPDLDQIYMTAVQLLTRHGGWPMSVFLTPDLKPFYGGTYFPPSDRHNLPSFKRLVQHLATAWRERRKEIEEQATQLTEHVQTAMAVETTPGARSSSATESLGPELLTNAANNLRRAFDPRFGGFGSAPKFPHPMDLRLLLRVWKRFGDEGALEMVRTTLDHMAMGGIYDQLGSGFHRYSTDERWLAPHFEKMLYDNALLCQTYLEAYQATGEPVYREVVEETLGYVLREMTSPSGPFFSTQDADSEGVEGKFFVWTRAEIEDLLGKEEAELFAAVFDITSEGNWEGHNIPHRTRTYAQESRMLRVPEDVLRQRLRASVRTLFDARCKRVRPARDEKILTAWNGLMIAAFAQAYQVLENPAYLDAAQNAARFLVERMRAPDGRLLRTTMVTPSSAPSHGGETPSGAGSQAKLNAYLEDYAYFIDSLVSLYEADFEPHWIESALDLTRVMIEQFWDEEGHGFFFTGKDHEKLIARTKDSHDNATPSGNAMAVTALLRLHKLTGDASLLEKAEHTLRLYRNLLGSSPMAAGQLLIALDFHLGPVDEFVVAGNPSAEDTKNVLCLIRRGFLPNKVVAGTRPGAGSVIPLLVQKDADDVVKTYLCRDFTCRQPVVGEHALAAALASLGNEKPR